MKESYYLRHDYNSRNDEKVLRLRQKYPNGSGYALFWMLLEKLAESSEGRLKLEDCDVLAFEIQMDSKWITDVIMTSGLFENDGAFFWSNRLLSDLAERDEKSKKAVLANKIRWDKTRKEAIIYPNGVQPDVHLESKERKGKERKEKERRKIKLPARAPLHSFGAVDGVILLTPDEYRRLCQKYGRAKVKKYILKIENWKIQNKKNLHKYSDDNRAIQSWINSDKDAGKFQISWQDFDESDFDSNEEYLNTINKYS